MYDHEKASYHHIGQKIVLAGVIRQDMCTVLIYAKAYDSKSKFFRIIH